MKPSTPLPLPYPLLLNYHNLEQSASIIRMEVYKLIYLTYTSPYSRYSTQFEDGGHGHVHENFPHSHFSNNCKLKNLQLMENVFFVNET